MDLYNNIFLNSMYISLYLLPLQHIFSKPEKISLVNGVYISVDAECCLKVSVLKEH